MENLIKLIKRNKNFSQIPSPNFLFVAVLNHRIIDSYINLDPI